MSMRPTPEQDHIRDLARYGGSMVIEAFAGAGKTTTLGLLADASPARSVTYLAFNKEIAKESAAKMPKKVRGQTFHSLAYRTMQPSQERLSQRLSGMWVANRFDLRQTKIGYDKLMTGSMLGSMVITTLARFCNSSSLELDIRHVPSMEQVFDNVPVDVLTDKAAWGEICSNILQKAKRLWAEQIDPAGAAPITHDTYLKHWVMRGGRINSDLIMIDEAQDASPVMLQLLRQQDAPVVWVGDKHQQIYGWRGAVNALSRVQADYRASLTESFRFGNDIASEANHILRYLGESQSITGRGNGLVGKDNCAYLCRTNGESISHYMALVGSESTIELVGARQLMAVVKQLKDLKEGRPAGMFSLFRSYAEVVEHSETEAGRDMSTMIKAVEEYGFEMLLEELDAAGNVPVGAADLTISTIHRAKGREWDHVELAADWSKCESNTTELAPEEARLLYVAITRARCTVDSSGVADWLAAVRHQAPHRPLDESKETQQLQPPAPPIQAPPAASRRRSADAAVPKADPGPPDVIVRAGLPADLVQAIDDLRDVIGMTREQIMRAAVREYIASKQAQLNVVVSANGGASKRRS